MSDSTACIRLRLLRARSLSPYSTLPTCTPIRSIIRSRTGGVANLGRLPAVAPTRKAPPTMFGTQLSLKQSYRAALGNPHGCALLVAGSVGTRSEHTDAPLRPLGDPSPI